MRGIIVFGGLLVAIATAACGGGSTCDTICGKYQSCTGSSGSCRTQCTEEALRMSSEPCQLAVEAWADCFDGVSCSEILSCQDECMAAATTCGISAVCGP